VSDDVSSLEFVLITSVYKVGVGEGEGEGEFEGEFEFEVNVDACAVDPASEADAELRLPCL